MNKTLEKLWYEYLSEECTSLRTDEERELTKKAIELHKEANALLNKEQEEAIEKYVDALYDIESHLTKKAFSKGCEFAVSFLLEAKWCEK